MPLNRGLDFGKPWLRVVILSAVLLWGLFLWPRTLEKGEAEEGPILYVYDLSGQHLNHYEYCVPLSSPGVFCERHGPPPEGKSFGDLLRDYDTVIFASTLQGVVNKNGPRLYLNHDHDRSGAPGLDKHWLHIFRERGKPYAWLADYEIRNISSLDELIDIFKEDVKGVVLWDTAVPATLNVATTIAGVEDLAVLRSGSAIEGQVVSRIPVQKSLAGKFVEGETTIPDSSTPATGSPKNDAYIWAKKQYLDTGKANPTLLAYFEDGWPAVLYSQNKMTRRGIYAFERDYVVQNRGFAFDLSPWAVKKNSAEAETPVDDPKQPPGTDLSTFKDIVRSARAQAGQALIRVWGYIPWYQKYSHEPDAGGTHSPAEGEWESTWLLSSYGAYLEGGAGDIMGIAMANMSVHRFAPFPERVVQPPPPTPEQLVEKGYLTPDGRVANKTYLLYYAGDYDLAHSAYVTTNGAWPRPWRDEKRGQMPMAWGFNPGLIEVMPDIMTYFLQTRTPQDFFIGPNSGAGYINPGALPEALDSIWTRHCLRYYRRLNYSIQGWIWNGKGGPITDQKKSLFTPFAGDGMVLDYRGLEGHWPRLLGNVPITAIWHVESGDVPTVEGVASNIHNGYKEYISRHDLDGPKFLIFRRTSYGPDFLWDVTERLKADDANGLIQDSSGLVLHPDYQVVDPYTFFYLMRIHLGGHNNYRATYVSDNIPAIVEPGRTYEVQVVARNDGWDTWYGGWREAPPHSYRLGFHVKKGDIAPRSLSIAAGHYPLRVDLPFDVPPGGTATFNFQWTAPLEEGTYTLQYDMIAEGLFSFEEQNDTPWQKTVVVKP